MKSLRGTTENEMNIFFSIIQINETGGTMHEWCAWEWHHCIVPGSYSGLFYAVGLQIFGGFEVIIFSGIWPKAERRLCDGQAFTKNSKGRRY